MNNTHLDQARDWANWLQSQRDLFGEKSQGARAAALTIQSLPDQWIDAEKVAELADDMANWSLPDGPSTTEIDYRRLIEIMDGFTGRINDLLTPPLPTLADLIEQGNDLRQYQWVQAEHIEHGRVIITHPGSTYIYYMKTSGLSGGVSHSGADRITPLPDLPRLEWPAQEPRNPETPPAETLNNTSSDTPRNPRPEDVPAGEAWRVKLFRDEVNALKTGHPHYPWSVSSKPEFDGRTAYSNAGVTLISRLVPEVKP